MRKKLKRLFGALLMFAIVFQMMPETWHSDAVQIQGADLSNYIQVVRFDLADSEGEKYSKSNAAGNVNDYEKKIQHGIETRLNIVWQINLSEQDRAIHEGDGFSFNILQEPDENTTSWVFGEMKDSPIYIIGKNDAIGTFSINSQGKLTAIFNDKIEGYQTAVGSLDTGLVLRAVTRQKEPAVLATKVKDVSQYYCYDKRTINDLDAQDKSAAIKYVSASTNHSMTWKLGTGCNFLSAYRVDAKNLNYKALSNKYSDYYLEDTFKASDGHKYSSVTIDTIKARVFGPTDAGKVSNIDVLSIDIKNELFRECTQNSNESYENFKARLKSECTDNFIGTYGTYEDNQGDITVVVYFASIPTTTLTYSKLVGNGSIGSHIKARYCTNADESKNLYTKDELEWFDETYNDAPVMIFMTGVTASLEEIVEEDLTIKNTVTCSWDGCDTPKLTSAEGIYRALYGTVTLNPKEVVLVKYGENKKPLADAEFKLQILEDGTWMDYKNGDTVIAKKTDSQGQLSFSDLKKGMYRFVETSAASGYDKNSVQFYEDSDLKKKLDDGVLFEVLEFGDQGHAIYATNKKSSGGSSTGGGSSVGDYTVTYDANGGSGIYKDGGLSSGAAYNVKSDKSTGIANTGWEFIGWNSKPDGTGTAYSAADVMKITSNVTLYAQWRVPTAPIKPELNKEDHMAYVIGYDDGTLRPSANISRAETATIFFRLLTDAYRNEVWSTNNDYTDVDTQQWYNNAVSTMANAGIIKGYADGTFGGNRFITRAEFAAIAARFDSNTYTGADQFSDISGHWAAEYINRAAQKGWITGYEDGTFKPDQNITRAEAMTLINRVLDRDKIKSMHTDILKFPDCSESAWYYEAAVEATNSHDYTRLADGQEEWTRVTKAPNWADIEKSWSSANSWH